MYAFFTLFPDWSYSSPLEVFIWVIVMSLAALLGVWFFITVTQDSINQQGQEFRGTFLFFATVALFGVGIVVATRGQPRPPTPQQQQQEQVQREASDRARTRSAP